MKQTGFKDSNEFCLHLEQIKIDHSFDGYIESLLWYHEHESDLEVEVLVKHLNPKIIEAIKYEAIQNNMLKEKQELVSLFG
jgi:hypothetical protein